MNADLVAARHRWLRDAIWRYLATRGPSRPGDIAQGIGAKSDEVRDELRYSAFFERLPDGNGANVWWFSVDRLADAAEREVSGMDSVPSWPVGYLAILLGAPDEALAMALRADPRWEAAEPSPWNGNPAGPWFRFAGVVAPVSG